MLPTAAEADNAKRSGRLSARFLRRKVMRFRIGKLLQTHSHSRAVGIDYAAVSVKKARAINRKSIAQGRCEVLRADVTKLPFTDARFDCVTAFETVYFWSDFAQSRAETGGLRKHTDPQASKGLALRHRRKERGIRPINTKPAAQKLCSRLLFQYGFLKRIL